MRRGSSNLIIVLGLLLLLIAGGAGAVMYLSPQGIIPGTAEAQLPPTAEPTVSVVTAAIDIEEGTLITSTDDLLKMSEVPASQFVEGSNLTSIVDARNMIATLTIKAGDPIRTDDLRKAGLAQKIPEPAAGEEPVKAFPVQVDSLSGVADLVQPGDFVDVLASFNMDVVTLRPGPPTNDGEKNVYTIVDEKTNEGSTKVLLQDVEVLDVIKPAPPAENANGDAQPQEETPPSAPAENSNQTTPPPATAGNTLQTGNWIIVVAVTNQEAEVMRFALDRGIGITTILRRAGDHTTERTVGATMRILVDNYGMPMPSFAQVSQQPMIVDVEGATKLPQVPAQNFTPKVETETGNR